MTKQQIEDTVAKLAKQTNQPLWLTVWSPGDGYSRYRIMRDSPSGTGAYGHTPYYRKKEMVAYLQGALFGAYAAK